MRLSKTLIHIKNQNWLNILIEIMIVIIGILIALGLDNRIQELNDNALEKTYLKMLKDDISLIRTQAKTQLEFEKYIVQLSDYIYKQIEKNQYTKDSEQAELISSALMALSIRTTFSISSPAFEDLKNSGNLKLLHDLKLRKQLIKYFTETNRIEIIVEKNNKNFVDETYAKFITNIGMSYRVTDDSLPEKFKAEFDILTSKLAHKQIKTNLFNQKDPIFEKQSSHKDWTQIKVQLSHRARISLINQLMAENVINLSNSIMVELSK